MTSVDVRVAVAPVDVDVESLPRLTPPGQWTLFWRRFKRDKFALGSLIVFILLVLLCFVGEPIIAHALGHGANDQFPFANGEALNQLHHVVGVAARYPTLFVREEPLIEHMKPVGIGFQSE